jgi:hypothetical protein
MLPASYAQHLTLGSLLEHLRKRAGGYILAAHWPQGELHHDTVLRVDPLRAGLPGPVLVVTTGCNGGIKELLCLDEVPSHGALWNRRCPDLDFDGEITDVLGYHRTVHWCDPYELLLEDARTEYRRSARPRQAAAS